MLSVVVNKLQTFDNFIQQHDAKFEMLKEDVIEIKNQLKKMEKTENSEWWRVCIIVYLRYMFVI